MGTRSYSELAKLETFEERFEYLVLHGKVGTTTFGFDRWLNQEFYTSPEWRYARNEVILRDNGCDLGIQGREVPFFLVVHHMNPLTVEEVEAGESWIVDPEFLICTSKRTHNQIHYGGSGSLPRAYTPRAPGDTKLW